MNLEIEQLIHNAFHAELTEAEAKRLSEWVTASEENARAYYRAVLNEKAIEHCLNRDSVIEVSALVDQADKDAEIVDLKDLARSEDLASPSLVELANCPTQPAAPKPPRHPLPRPETRPGPSSHEPVLSLMGVHVYRGGGISLTRLALAAALACAAAVGLMAWLDSPDPRPAEIADAQTPEPEADTPAVVARIVSSVDVRWADGETRPVDHELLVGDRVAIDEGYLTLRSIRGVQITVQGPCSMTAVDDNRFYIDHGRLIASVPPAAIYFALDTPTARIVDYGTEFGVQVDAKGNTDAVVMDGLIELAEADMENPGAVPQTRRKVQLSAGWSSSVTVGKGLQDQAVAFDLNRPDHFANGLMRVSNPTFRFRQAVIQSRPIAYWTFEKPVGDRIDNLITPDRYGLKRHGRVQVTEDQFGMAAHFVNRPNANDYLRSSEAIEALADQDQYAVSVWFKPDGRLDGRLLGIATFDRSQNIYQHAAVLETIAHTGSSYKQPAPPNSARFLHRDPPGNDSATGNNAYAPGIEPGRWYHLVAVKHPERIEIYLNGVHHESVADTGKIGEAPDIMIGLSHSIHGGVSRDDDEQRRPFRGLIDEVAIYDRALTAEEIKEQYQLGSQ